MARRRPRLSLPAEALVPIERRIAGTMTQKETRDMTMKILRDQETCSRGGAQGCGDPDCPICMPKDRPEESGGALVAPSDEGASEWERQLNQGLAEEVARQFVFNGRRISAAFTTTAQSQPKRDPERDRAEREERDLRGKIERFFLKTKHTVAWDDVVGNEAARQALVEAIEHPVVHKELYAHYRKKPTKGVLLYGPPGCGKTMFGKAAASVLAKLHGREVGEHTMIHVKGPEIQSPYVGVTESIIRDIFAYARAYRVLHGYPLVVFIDEADAILPSRDGTGAARRALPWEESNVATFLTEMDGLEDSGALVILATNRPHSIDSALLRDGRCDRKIRVERPGRMAVRAIFERCLTGVPMAPAYSAAEIAEYGVHCFFAANRRLLSIHSAQGHHFLTLGDIVNGAMATGVVEMAKAAAFNRDLAAGGKPTGVSPADIEAAVDSVFAQNAGLNHADALAEFCERHGIQSGTISGVHAPERPALSPAEIDAVLRSHEGTRQ